MERKTEESKRMKNHLEKLQREIQEARHSKHDKERQLGDAQQRVEKMQRAMAAGISEKSDLEAELIRLREQFRSGRNNTSRNVMVLQSRISDMDNRIGDDRRELEFSTEKVSFNNFINYSSTERRQNWTVWQDTLQFHESSIFIVARLQIINGDYG